MPKSVMQRTWIKKITTLGAVGVVLAGCASQPTDMDQVNDPLEPVNRAVFAFNEVVDTWFLRPAATLYKGVLPPPVTEGIHNVLSNLSAPVVLLNDILQGETERAETTLTRFAINSTVGVLGIRDKASEMGYKEHKEDFGQTLGAWGVGEGAYIVLPVFGPSSGRDTVGLVVDYFTDPLNNWATNTGHDAIPTSRAVLGALDTRSSLDNEIQGMKKSSLDPYVAFRSFYLQNRKSEVENRVGPQQTSAPSLSFDVEAPGASDEEITEAR